VAANKNKRSRIAASTADSAYSLALPVPQKLPEGITHSARVMRLIDMDSVSHGLVDGTPRRRASDQDVQLFLDIVQDTACALDPGSRVRCAASSVTARHHLDVLTASGNNQWTIRRGLDGADHALLEDMDALISARRVAATSGRLREVRHANLLILVGQDHIYTAKVRELRLLGIPTWLIVPGRLAAWRLRSSSCAVSRVIPPLTAPCQLSVRRES
jgi:hypothetical protein